MSEYLQCELFHVLGAYGLAEARLADLSERVAKRSALAAAEDEDGTGTRKSGFEALEELVGLSEAYNRELKWNRYSSTPRLRTQSGNGAADAGWPMRETVPEDLPLSKVGRFAVATDDRSIEKDRPSPWKTDKHWEPIPRFYGLVIATLERTQEKRKLSAAKQERIREQFAKTIVAPRDGGNGAEDEIDLARLGRRLTRYDQRLREALESVAGHEQGDGSADGADNYKVKTEKDLKSRLAWITSDLEGGPDSTAMYVLQAHAEAHLSMHAVEVWRNLSLGGQAESIKSGQVKWLDEELDRCIALSTFAFCAGRIMPWIFAKDPQESAIVLGRPVRSWENMIPVRCIWIATQVSLLSLHRRAYARALKEDPMGAYNDYHKLQYLIRDTERRVRSAPLHVDGALVFLAGLNAEAHHHIGELYRSQHAHRPALEHFRAAFHGLGKLKSEVGGAEILTNSRWFVELQISHGKACYEMGRHKEALHWHLSAWQSFLGLLSSETSTQANTDAIEEALDWLDRVKYEPDIRKSEVDAWIGPVVEQLDRITVVGRLGALASEILLRLGHLLFVLNISPEQRLRGAGDEGGRTAALAVACLVKAGECDQHSTLVAADLLKAALRQRRDDGQIAEEILTSLGSSAPLDEQWPGGGGDFEELARAAEYLVLRGQLLDRRGETGGGPERTVARALLLDLFMSTDSTDVRKSQIHRFLMRKRTRGGCPASRGKSVELICMRRYSSAFPLLPRPSAFRALGGGYFMRVQAGPLPAKDGRPPLGIVVDPGVDFVENLYRTDYTLSDIDMIVVTHDHVDHLGGLDPLLSLLHVRSQILSKEKTKPGVRDPAEREVTVLTSRSVYRRYRSAAVLQWSKSLSFRCFEDEGAAEDTDEGGPLERYDPVHEVDVEGVAHRFEIVPMSSQTCNPREPDPGHRDLSFRASFGICVRIRPGGPSVAITSDTPEPQAGKASRESWSATFAPALDADILVCHLGSVPLTELRRMDGYDPANLNSTDALLAPLVPRTREDERALKKFRTALQEANPRRLRGQVEYAHWLRSHQRGKALVPAAELVGKVDSRWLPPRDHNYLRGLLTWAQEFKGRSPKLKGKAATLEEGAGPRVGGRLFVVGELSEELGTMRGKLAARLNQHVFAPRRSRGELADDGRWPHSALTADIGLHACVSESSQDVRAIEVLCTTCNLDTDRAREERHHAASEIDEVCVKGENEGIFYNCAEHHPTSRKEDEVFLERLERFDIFGR
jgi:hypothetical protein